jgi:hypothetical protein
MARDTLNYIGREQAVPLMRMSAIRRQGRYTLLKARMNLCPVSKGLPDAEEESPEALPRLTVEFNTVVEPEEEEGCSEP